MLNDKVRVSVIIPVYNEERYIRGCIESLIRQDYPIEEMEWIFIDGASTDNTKNIIEEYSDKFPIILINNPLRKTPISLNIGIKNAKGEYIIRFDAHTAFKENYISRCIYYLKTTKAENVGGYVETKSNGFLGNAIAKILSSRFGVGGSSFRTKAIDDNVDTVPFGAFRKELFDKIGLFNEELLRSEDNDMNARIRASGGRILLVPDIVSTYYCRDSIHSLLKMGVQNGNALFRTFRVNKNAMSLRHFIPFVFLMSLIIFPIMIYFVNPIKYLFFVELICYALLDIYYSIQAKKYGIITFWLFPLFHLSYGLGSLMGVFGIEAY